MAPFHQSSSAVQSVEPYAVPIVQQVIALRAKELWSASVAFDIDSESESLPRSEERTEQTCPAAERHEPAIGLSDQQIISLSDAEYVSAQQQYRSALCSSERSERAEWPVSRQRRCPDSGVVDGEYHLGV